MLWKVVDNRVDLPERSLVLIVDGISSDFFRSDDLGLLIGDIYMLLEVSSIDELFGNLALFRGSKIEDECLCEVLLFHPLTNCELAILVHIEVSMTAVAPHVIA